MYRRKINNIKKKKKEKKATTEDIYDYLLPEIRKNQVVAIIQAGTNKLISNTKLLENHKGLAESV